MFKFAIRACACLVTFLACASACAQTLYAASFRTSNIGETPTAGGSLYTVNLGSSTATFVGSLRLNGKLPIGITGMYAHPQTGVFYGVTSSQSPNARQSLVTIDVATGNATLVAEMRYPVSDLAFNRAGVLYVWLPETSQLGVVNITNGAVTPVGPARPAGTGSGLAIDPSNTGYITPAGASGTLDRIDLATGVIVKGPQLTGAPFPAGVASLTFTPSGLLLAVNSNAGSPAVSRMVTINTSTGVVSIIGALPDDTEVLAFTSDSRRAEGSEMNVQTIALISLGVIALLLALVGWFVGRKPAR